jgi:hypothetical protein
MLRSRQRATLEEGSSSTSTGCLARASSDGAQSGPATIQWTNTWSGEAVAGGIITANMEGSEEGWLRIQIGDRSADRPRRPAPSFRRMSVVFQVSCHAALLFGIVDATRRDTLLQPSTLAQASRLCLSV